MTTSLANLYPAHLARVKFFADRALEQSRFDHLLIGAGVEKFQFLDDRPYVFAINPQFKWWLPLTHHAGSWIVYTPGQKPLLIYLQPDDYWHIPPSPPSGYWVEHFDIHIITDANDATKHFPASRERCAMLAESDAALGDWVPNNPAAVIHSLHYHRAAKSDYELALMRNASARGARAHRAAEQAFRARASELEIQRAYCAAVPCAENELPYGNIVCLNEHGATLHYQYQESRAPREHHAMLIDAGAQESGYACDITRTHVFDRNAGDGADEFGALIDAMDAAQLQLVDAARIGVDYRDLHVQSHEKIADILQAHDLVRMSPQAMVETGVSSIFFPHGLGHLLGAQVHDVAGFALDESGATIPKPAGHPYLRLTRTLQENFVLTIEPGLYFIPSLLNSLRARPQSGLVNWAKIERMMKFGGIRIEDDIRVRHGAPENLTRDAFAAM